jgi:hypothetical protein
MRHLDGKRRNASRAVDHKFFWGRQSPIYNNIESAAGAVFANHWSLNKEYTLHVGGADREHTHPNALGKQAKSHPI